MDILEKYSSSNSEVFTDLLSVYEIDHLDEGILNRELEESDMLDFVIERCKAIFELNHYWSNEHSGVGESDFMRFFIIKHGFQYISITQSMISDEAETVVKILNRLPTTHCFETCKLLFELVDLFLSNSMDLKEDNPEYWERVKPDLDITWTIDLLTYLRSNGFDVSGFKEIQQHLNDFNGH